MAHDVTMYSGDSKTLTISIVDGDGDAVDVSTAGSTVTVTLEPDDTADLAGVFYYELQITDESGNVSTAMSGAITGVVSRVVSLTGIVTRTVALTGVVRAFVGPEPPPEPEPEPEP